MYSISGSGCECLLHKMPHVYNTYMTLHPKHNHRGFWKIRKINIPHLQKSPGSWEPRKGHRRPYWVSCFGVYVYTYSTHDQRPPEARKFAMCVRLLNGSQSPKCDIRPNITATIIDGWMMGLVTVYSITGIYRECSILNTKTSTRGLKRAWGRKGRKRDFSVNLKARCSRPGYPIIVSSTEVYRI